MNVAEKAAMKLREAAEAYRALPPSLQSRGLLFGNQLLLDPDKMDEEADRIEQRVEALKVAMREAQ